MNALHPLIALMGRFPLYVAMGVLLAMPLGAWWAKSGYQDYQTAHERVERLRQQRAELEQQQAQMQEYQRFADEVHQFVQAAEGHRLAEGQGWITYTVDIKEKIVTASELRTMLEQAGPTDRYYFKPKRLEITSLFAKDLLPARVLNRLHGKSSTGGPSQVTEPIPQPGAAVLLSLTGHYLLFPRS
ncbi:MAG: hypothetical protein G8237_08720 [Magnetococcales bacterium]|nr:hypothetical protein [Magnetococcales bacterium]